MRSLGTQRITRVQPSSRLLYQPSHRHKIGGFNLAPILHLYDIIVGYTVVFNLFTAHPYRFRSPSSTISAPNVEIAQLVARNPNCSNHGGSAESTYFPRSVYRAMLVGVQSTIYVECHTHVSGVQDSKQASASSLCVSQTRSPVLSLR